MNTKKQIIALARQKGLIRAHDVESAGISRNHLYLLHKRGVLLRVARGLYALPDAPISITASLAGVSKRIPHGVICLISALSHHEITTQIPHQIWVAVPRGAWRPDFDYPPLNLTYLSKKAYSFGIQEFDDNGVTVKIYSPAKTVADCFKFRSRVGLDVAIEALRKVWRSRKASMDELTEAARVNRVSKIMRPYLEAIV